MKLLIEEVQNVEYLIEEAGNGQKKYSISGIFMQADLKNKNGRIYPRHILEREVNRYNTEYIKENRAVGELGHPTTGPSINLDRISHKIVEMKQDGNNFTGKAVILETPFGQIAKGLLEGGVKLGVSSRGVGTLTAKNGYQSVNEDYRLVVAGDIVADPSAPEAWMSGIMENVEWILNESTGEWVQRHLPKMKQMSVRELEEKRLQLFESFLNSLNAK